MCVYVEKEKLTFSKYGDSNFVIQAVVALLPFSKTQKNILEK